MTKSKVSVKAFTKTIFHACKYPSQPVNGILLGEFDGETVIVTDCIPLFHNIHNISTLPMLEIALMQIDLMSKQSQKGNGTSFQIVGYYFGNECFEDIEFSVIHKTIANKLSSLSSNERSFIVWQIDNARLQPESIDFPLRFFQLNEQQKDWKYLGKEEEEKKEEEFKKQKISDFHSEFVDESLNSINFIDVHNQLKSKLMTGVFQQIVDFDTHLDDIHKDYRNSHLEI